MSSLCSPTCLATESPATLAKNWGLTNPLLHLDVFGGTHTYGMRPWLRLAHSVALRNLEKCYPSSALFQGIRIGEQNTVWTPASTYHLRCSCRVHNLHNHSQQL